MFIAMQNKNELDSIVQKVIHDFTSRAAVGLKKYGTNLDRTDLSLSDWIQHAREEAMDLILYLTKLEEVMKNKQVDNQDVS